MKTARDDDSVKAVVGCNDVTYGEPCAICDMPSFVRR